MISRQELTEQIEWIKNHNPEAKAALNGLYEYYYQNKQSLREADRRFLFRHGYQIAVNNSVSPDEENRIFAEQVAKSLLDKPNSRKKILNKLSIFFRWTQTK